MSGIMIAATFAAIAAAAMVGIFLGSGVSRKRPAATPAPTARIIGAYSDSLRALREAQRGTADPAQLAKLATEERRLRILTAVGLGGILHRPGEPELRADIEDKIREILSAFFDAGDILAEVEKPYFKGLAEEDPGFARDLTGLLEFLVGEEKRGVEARRRELKELKAQEAEVRKELTPGGAKRKGHEGHGHE
jgi:hypothetical protein